MKGKYLFLIFGILSIIGTLNACGSFNRSIDENKDIVITLSPSPERSQPIRYEIGEYIGYSFSIVNHTEEEIELKGISFCNYNLAFALPAGIHLIDPHGEDLMIGYEEPEVLPDACEQIHVKPHEEYIHSIFISEWIFLTEEGEYKLWVEFVDQNGASYKSNAVSFTLFKEPLNIGGSSKNVSLNIEIPKREYRLVEWKDSVYITITFKNNMDTNLTFLKPQYGSLGGWVNPTYRITILDSHGRGYRQSKPSGDAPPPPVYNESTTVTLKPGQAFSFPLKLPSYPNLTEPDTYRLRLTYLAYPNALVFGRITEEELGFGPGVLTGMLESNEVLFEIKP